MDQRHDDPEQEGQDRKRKKLRNQAKDQVLSLEALALWIRHVRDPCLGG